MTEELPLSTDPDQRKLVAGGLWQTGYRAAWMLGRDGEDRIPSSRGLLLALGWLLATGTLERLLTQRAPQLNKLLLTSTLVCVIGTTSTAAFTLASSTPLSLRCGDPCVVLMFVFQVTPQMSHVVQLDGGYLRRLQWLIGCLRAQGRILLSMQEERARLLHGVRSSTLSRPKKKSPTDFSCVT